jgi:hypothetical protein
VRNGGSCGRRYPLLMLLSMSCFQSSRLHFPVLCRLVD